MVSPSTLCTTSVLLFSSFTFAFPSLFKRATVSPDGTCGPAHGYTCQGSNFGNSCGKYNLCGRDTSYSELSRGCQPAYGFCYPKGSISPDGSCGGSDMFVCIGSNFGNSCGPNNLCGRDAGYSGNGCQPQYGYCAQCTTTVPPSTSVTTVRTTTTSPVTVSASTTVTVTSGISSVYTTTTTTNTITPTPVTTTSTVGAITTVSSGTVTVSSVSAPVFNKRDATLLLPLPLMAGATSAAPATTSAPFSNTTTAAARLRARQTVAGDLSCGTVISTGFTTKTITTTTTLTAFSTTTTVSSSFTTIPSSTTTITSTSTASTTLAPSTTTSTTTSFSTVTVPAATATVVSPGPVYSKAYELTNTNTCFETVYYEQVGVSADTSNNDQTAVMQCGAACTSDSSCESFYVSHSTDPSGQPGNYCLLDHNPYANGDISCNYQTTTTYLVVYNKVQ